MRDVTSTLGTKQTIALDNINNILVNPQNVHAQLSYEKINDEHWRHIFCTVVNSEQLSILSIIDYYVNSVVINLSWFDAQKNAVQGIRHVLHYNKSNVEQYFVEFKPILNISESLLPLAEAEFISKPKVFFGDRNSYRPNRIHAEQCELIYNVFANCHTFDDDDYIIMADKNGFLYLIMYVDRATAITVIELAPGCNPRFACYNFHALNYDNLLGVLTRLSGNAANQMRSTIQDWERTKANSDISEPVGMSWRQSMRQQLEQCMVQSKETIVTEQELADITVQAWQATFTDCTSLNKAVQEQMCKIGVMS